MIAQYKSMLREKNIFHQFRPKILYNTKYDVDAHLAYGVK